MPVTLILRGQEIQLPTPIALEAALRMLDLEPETWLAIRDGALIPPETLLSDGDRVQLIAQIAGG